ncbi:MAG: HlyD family efflux transporter periplasmic adaptor subunit [Candidatus Ozemobacteraceae bacterium]
MKKLIGTIGTTLFIIGFIFFAWSSFHAIRNRQENASKMQVGQAAMQVVSLKEGVGVRTIPAMATLKSGAAIKVMPETAGKIIFLNKREGDVVTAGEIIARIEGDELQTQLRVAGAQSSSVEKQTIVAEENIRSLSSQRPALVTNERFWNSEQERDRKLLQQGALSKAQAEGTANKFAEAQGKLAALDAQILASRAQKQAVASQRDSAVQNVALWKVRNRYAEVTAPVAGIISARFQEEGNYVTPNSVLYQLEDTRVSRLVLQIPQQFVQELKLGQRLIINDDGLADISGFLLTRIYPMGNELRQRIVEAESSEPLSHPDFDRQFSVNVVSAEASGTIIPADGFFQADSGRETEKSTISFYLVEGATARRKELTPLLMTDTGEAVVAAYQLPPESKLVRLGFLQYARMPASISLQGGGTK